MVHVTLMARWRGEGGSALSPTAAQFSGIMQGTAAVLLPMQYDRTGHGVSTPPAQKLPGMALPGQPAWALTKKSLSAQRRRRRGGALRHITVREARGAPTFTQVPPLHAKRLTVSRLAVTTARGQGHAGRAPPLK